jgi:leucyl aminopeptidase (aminopeptidase T)
VITLKASEAAKNALENVLKAKTDERILIICDEEKKAVGDAFAKGALTLNLWTRLLILKKQKEARKEIPRQFQNLLQKPDIYINILKGNREETPFRIKLIKTETQNHKSRLGHCPGVTIDMLTHGALALTQDEHKKIQYNADKLIHALKNTVKVEIYNQAGTNLTLQTKDRQFFTDTKIDLNTMKWINLPAGEVLIAPNEDSLNGKLVCDMAIGGIGKLRKPVQIIAKNGKVEKVSSLDKDHQRNVNETLKTDNWAKVIGEFAFGINPKARMLDKFLETEKIFGTIHVAFGNNIDMPGGKNPSKNHMDMLISEPSVLIIKENGEKIKILEKGQFKI